MKSIRTSARRDGGDYVLKGSKMFITNGALADVYFVAAKTDPAAGSKGISMFIVEKGMQGFSVGRKLDKMGWRSSDTAELVFDDCRVPAANLLGEENRGFYAIMKNFQNERIAIAAMAMGEAAQGDRAHAGVRAARARPSARRCGTSRRSGSGCRCSRRRSRRAGSSCARRVARRRRAATA